MVMHLAIRLYFQTICIIFIYVRKMEIKFESAKTDCLFSLAMGGIPLHTNNYNASWHFSWKHLQDPTSFLA
jgi:hypothetical protein